MGYSAATIVIYGVELQPTQAKEFIEDLENVLILMGSPNIALGSLEHYEIMEACKQYLGLDKIFILGEGADSRSDDCEWYSPNDSHLWGYSLGFEIPSTSQSVIKALKEPIKPQWKSQWKYILKPILDISTPTPAPKKLTVAQTH